MYVNRQVSAGPEQQYPTPVGNNPFNYSPYPAHMGGMVDNTYQSSPQHLSPPSARHSLHTRPASNDWNVQHTQSSSSLSPRAGRAKTPTGSNAALGFTPADRVLPQRDVTAETITDAYEAFVLYCNPRFPLDIDATILRANFQSPPKSDNKDFEIYRLFELLQKFDAKEIKTWGQLALDLGVEAPDVSKGQSVQKVQQYSVRLKRWMRAMHVDAFFEYLLGKQHVYFTEIPNPDDPHAANVRDGVVADEDLAIRALDPAFRPKRGRRRNSESENQDPAERGTSSKRSRAGKALDHDLSGSSHPNLEFNTGSGNASDPWAVASAVTPQSFAPWAKASELPHSALDPSAPSLLRWQFQGGPQSAVTPHPMSAMPSSMAMHIDAAFDNEPRSAVTPSTRKRRKHGPAVSSAWPSANAPGAKPRGRPPASRNVQDGPFSTFPADPSGGKSGGVTFSAPVAAMKVNASVVEEPGMPPPTSRHSESGGRPGRLSLQVPPSTGGPVRLATPPRVLLNGENNDSDRSSTRTPIVTHPAQQPFDQSRRQRNMQPIEREMPGFAFEALKRVLASDLLRADIFYRRQRLSGDEAKRLADAILDRLDVPRADTNKANDDIARLTAASWLGVGEQLNVPLGPATGQTKRITATRFRVDADGYEEIVSAYDEAPDCTREVFDIKWGVSMGGCNGSFEMKGLSLGEPEERRPDMHDTLLDAWDETTRRAGQDDGHIQRAKRALKRSGLNEVLDQIDAEEHVDWKAQYQGLLFGSKLVKGEFDRYRQRITEKVLDALME